MNSLPAGTVVPGSGMITTFQNSAQVLSIGIFFSLMIIGLSSVLPTTLYHGLVQQGVPAVVATGSPTPAGVDPVRGLFRLQPDAAPLGPGAGPPPRRAGGGLEGRSFFPTSSPAPFHQGLHAAFDFAIGRASCRGGLVEPGPRYVHAEEQVIRTDKGSSAIDPSAPLERPVS